MKRSNGGAVERWSGRFATIALALTLVATPVRAQDVGLDIGTVAPAAKVHTLDGKEVDLTSYIGKSIVVMEFWATWCPNCAELEPTLLDVLKKYDKQVTFVGVAVSVNQSPARVKAYVEKHKMPGEHVFDTKGNATGAYDAPATSYVLVINKAGKVVYTGLGGKQNLDAAIKKAL